MTESNVGWIEWHGGDCPVAVDVPVRVRFRCGSESDKGTSDSWRWGHAKDGDMGKAYDIVAYRLLPQSDTSADDAKSIESIIAQFPQGAHLEIAVVFPGEYRIGYRYQDVHYLPGTPSYYPLEEALQKCLDAFRERFSA